MHLALLQIPLLGVALSKAPSTVVWNQQIKAAWTQAYQSAQPAVLGNYEIEHIDGTIPRTLSGTVWRNGPANFERGGERFKHVLDGDGLICRFTIDGVSGRASFAGRFVETPEFVEESTEDSILYRNTFGTQPAL